MSTLLPNYPVRSEEIRFTEPSVLPQIAPDISAERILIWLSRVLIRRSEYRKTPWG